MTAKRSTWYSLHIHSKLNCIRNTPRFSSPKYMLAAENYGDSEYVMFCETLPFTKADKNMIFTAAVSTSFGSVSVSQNWLHIENRRNFLQLTHIFGHENRGVLRMQFGFEWMCSEYHVLRLAGAEVHYIFAVESRGTLYLCRREQRSTSRGRYDIFARMSESSHDRGNPQTDAA